MVVKFASGMTTHTPGLSKRAGTVFAAAPMVQGKWDGSGTPDVLSFARGAQIASNWYGQFDPYQGGGFCNFKPEQSSGARTGLAYLWYVSAAYHMEYDYTNGRYSLTVGTQTMTLTQAIVAGTMEYIAWGYDTRTTLDGTNYAYISRNDAQTFGITIAPTASAPDATICVGSNGTAGAANSIIGGLLFVREIPWTGAYGTNLGNGDVVAAHAAAADAALSLGSWGSTFSLPTNAAVGALVTGTGEAWSHPHGSALLGDSWCQTVYATPGAWATYGAPSAGPTDQADATKVFQWGYQWTCNAAGAGVTQTKAGQAAGANYVMRLIAHCTSANAITVQIYDNTNGAAITTYSFGASSTRTAPGVALITWELPTVARNGVAADCVSFAVRIYGTAAAQVIFLHQVECQPNLLDNPSLETGAVANPWIPDGWVIENLDAGDTQKSSTGGAIIHSGADCMQFNVGAEDEGIYLEISLPLGAFAALGGWGYGDTVAGAKIYWDPNHLLPQTVLGGAGFFHSSHAATWTWWGGVIRGTRATGNPRMFLFADSNAIGTRYIDDVWAVALTAVSLTATPASALNSVESGGLRVDGRDLCTRPITGLLAATVGDIYFRIRPRHSPANMMKWLEAVGAYYMAIFYGDATHYIALYSGAANNLTLEFNDGGGLHSAAWNCTGAWYANDLLDFHVRYTPSRMDLLRGPDAGTILASIVTAIDFGGVIPATAYWGSNAAGANQGDAVFSDPVFMGVGGRHGMRSDGSAVRDRSERIGHPTFRH